MLTLDGALDHIAAFEAADPHADAFWFLPLPFVHVPTLSRWIGQGVSNFRCPVMGRIELCTTDTTPDKATGTGDVLEPRPGQVRAGALRLLTVCLELGWLAIIRLDP